jgi:alpha-methylacyl-CoA racemase
MTTNPYGFRLGLPLRGFRVVTLAVNVPGPVAAAQLSRFGAEVFKIEPPRGDPLGIACPKWYQDLVGAQHVLRLNLKEQNDRCRLDRLLEKSDLLLTSSRPSALKRLSLGWKQLHGKFPELCQIALVGYPGRRRGIAGHDLTYQAQFGLLDPPALPVSLWADVAGSQCAIVAALCLLLGPKSSKTGRYAEVSIAESLKIFAAPQLHGLTTKRGPLGGALPEYNLYRSSDGWVAVAALEPHFSTTLKTELRVVRLNRKSVASVFRRKTARQWEKWALDRDLPIAAVRFRGL